MGSPVSHRIANAKMEEFKDKALASAPNPPHVWYWYVCLEEQGNTVWFVI